jgi:hypothetical protein
VVKKREPFVPTKKVPCASPGCHGILTVPVEVTKPTVVSCTGDITTHEFTLHGKLTPTHDL